MKSLTAVCQTGASMPAINPNGRINRHPPHRGDGENAEMKMYLSKLKDLVPFMPKNPKLIQFMNVLVLFEIKLEFYEINLKYIIEIQRRETTYSVMQPLYAQHDRTNISLNVKCRVKEHKPDLHLSRKWNDIELENDIDYDTLLTNDNVKNETNLEYPSVPVLMKDQEMAASHTRTLKENLQKIKI
uniref:Uncharacterized protein n=1 Tax=Glossina brevipalpis TaxID=37001 RepID=A0A1A9WHC6_9MUSC